MCQVMVRTLAKAALILSITGGMLCATTLENLTVDQMVQKSHLIVRGKAASASVVQRGTLLYTVHRIQVAEWVKGQGGQTVDVYVPGGTLGRLRQTFAGAPKLDPGIEYVVFVWTGKTGINHIIGLSQGLFNVKVNLNGETVLTRGALDAHVVDGTGKEVDSDSISLSYRELRAKVGRSGAAVR